MEEEQKSITRFLEKIEKLSGMQQSIEAIENSIDKMKKHLERNRNTSIKIGTGTRHETKVYIDPSKTVESRERVDTAVDMLVYGQQELEKRDAALEEDEEMELDEKYIE